ncbi:MAG: TonB-dependent receptor [Pseudomonadota bacterium]
MRRQSATKRFTACLSMALALSPLPAFGESSLDEIIVEASRMQTPIGRLPFAADVIDQTSIQQARPLLGLDESLQSVPGLLLQNRFNYAQDLRISMRGFGARSAFGIRGVRIVVDGIPETLADGQGGIDGIDLGSAERIEVLRGGASAIYGNAGGGVILIESERGGETPTLSVGLASGSDGYERVQSKFKGQAGRLNYLFNASNLSYDGYRDHNEARNRQYNLRMAYAASDRDNWLFSAHHTDQPIANDPGGITREQAELAPTSARDANVSFNAGEVLTQTRLGARYQRSMSNGGELTLRQYWLQREFDGLLPFQGGGAIDLDRRYAGSGLQYRQPFVLAGRQHQLVGGLDYDVQNDQRARFDNVLGQRGAETLRQNERVTSVGAYLQAEFDVSDSVLMTIGARRDRLRFRVLDQFAADGDASGERRFSEWSPLAGVHWQFSDNASVYVNASRSFESPTTTELANPSAMGGFNPALESQLARHGEIGLRVTVADGHRLNAAVYRIELDGELIPFELPAFPGRDFFANAGESRRNGFESVWRAQWSPAWQSSLTYTWSDFRFRRFVDDNGNVFDGNRVPGTARHVGHAAINYAHTSGWYARGEASYVNGIVLDNANTERTDSHILVELAAGTQWASGDWMFAPYVTLSNVFDEAYTANARINAFGRRFFEPGPGRSIFIGINITRDFAR